MHGEPFVSTAIRAAPGHGARARRARDWIPAAGLGAACTQAASGHWSVHVTVAKGNKAVCPNVTKRPLTILA